MLYMTGWKQSRLRPGVLSKLAAGKQSAYDSQFLARIKRDVPLALSLADVAYQGAHKRELAALFTRLEFFAFLKKMGLDEATDGEPVKVDSRAVLAEEMNLVPGKNMRLPLILSRMRRPLRRRKFSL